MSEAGPSNTAPAGISHDTHSTLATQASDKDLRPLLFPTSADPRLGFNTKEGLLTLLNRVQDSGKTYIRDQALLLKIYNNSTKDYRTVVDASLTQSEKAYNQFRGHILQAQSEVHASILNLKDLPNMETTDQFLSHISNFVRQKNAQELRSYLAVGPNFNDQYYKIIQELRQHVPKGSEKLLDAKCSASLPEARDGFGEDAPWGAFVNFMAQYLIYLRDLNVDNLLDTYNLLRSLVQKCNTAMSHPTLGVLMLPSLITYSGSLAHFAMMLDKRPDLMATVKAKAFGDGEEESETLPELAARVIREGFVACLNDRSGSSEDGNKVENKKVGIYKLANICLKVYFACHKSHNSNDIFRNIYKYSPPLALYPHPDQVTYLYYLGRFLFDNQHVYRAALALQEAYGQCSVRPEYVKQRRLILIQLVASNLILGRYPSEELYNRPEAYGFKDVFEPVCDAIKKGDIRTFHRLFDFEGPCFEFFWKHNIYYQLEGRCVVILNRCFVRKVFLLKGDHGDAQSKKAPTLMLKHLSAAYKFLKKGEPDIVSEDQRDGQSSGRPHYPSEVQEKLDIMDMESIVTSLISQGLINGYLSHKHPVRLAISGAKTKGALAAGFPPPYEVLTAKADKEVPGWKKQGVAPVAQVPGGNVVNLSGVKPIGSGAFK